MDFSLEEINKNCAAVAAREAYDALHNQLVSKYLAFRVPYKDAAGRTIKECRSFGGYFIIIFDDGKYTAVENDEFSGISNATLPIDFIQSIGLMEAEDVEAQRAYQQAVSTADSAANRARDLANLVRYYGKDILKEMLSEEA